MKTLSVSIVITLSCMVCAIAYADITDGMVSAWSFNDGTAKDLLGKNDGIIHGATQAEGKYGSCLSFDGKDNYVEIPDSPSLQLPEGITVAAWININNGIISAPWKGTQADWGANYSWRLFAWLDAGFCVSWGRCTGQENWEATDNIPDLSKGEWVHLAVTSYSPDTATTVSCYVNGEEVSDISRAGGIKIEGPYIVSEGEPVLLGFSRFRDSDDYSDGMIDEVVIYDRGLTADEVNELMTVRLSTVMAVSSADKLVSVWGKIKQFP